MKNHPTNMQVLTTALMGFLLLTGIPVANAASTDPAIKPEGPAITVSMTAYNAVPEQTSSHPNVTASGAFSDPAIVVARSVDLARKLPYGTVIAIEAASSSPTCGYGVVKHLIGYRVIADAMNSKWRNKIDVLLPLHDKKVSGNPANTLGHCRNVTIRVVGHVDVNDMPTSQKELADAIAADGDLASAQ